MVANIDTWLSSFCWSVLAACKSKGPDEWLYIKILLLQFHILCTITKITPNSFLFFYLKGKGETLHSRAVVTIYNVCNLLLVALACAQGSVRLKRIHPSLNAQVPVTLTWPALWDRWQWEMDWKEGVFNNKRVTSHFSRCHWARLWRHPKRMDSVIKAPEHEEAMIPWFHLEWREKTTKSKKQKLHRTSAQQQSQSICALLLTMQ